MRKKWIGLHGTRNGCCPAPGCCGTGPAAAAAPSGAAAGRQLRIDFLFLDLDVCTRCRGTDSALEEAVRDVAQVLESAGIEVLVTKINVSTEELAVRHRFASSPTIRVDGRDIALDVRESLCESCGDLCGDAVDCRVWTWQGIEYTQPPKAMIVDAILKAVYGAAPAADRPDDGKPYRLPENLSRFYQAMREKKEC